MSSDMSWNTPEISPDEREAARAAARREGLSLSEWLTRRIENGEARPASQEQNSPAPEGMTSTPLQNEPNQDQTMGHADAHTQMTDTAASIFPTQDTDGIRDRIEEQLQLLSEHLSSEIAAAHSVEQQARPQDTTQTDAIERVEQQLARISGHIEALLAGHTATSVTTEDMLGGITPDAVLRALAGLDEHLTSVANRSGTRQAELAKDMLVVTGKLDRLHADLAAQSAILENRLQSLDTQMATASLAPPRLKSWGMSTEPAVQATTLPVPAEDTPRKWDDSVAGRRSRRLIAAAAGVLILAGVSGGLALSWPYLPAQWRSAVTFSSQPDQPATPQVATGNDTDKLIRKAKGGDAHAALALGLKYADSTPIQGAEAVKWLEIAAASEPEAGYRLADMYARGTGVTADPVKAANLYMVAAAASNRLAMYQLASAYAAGIGVKQDNAAAAHWFQQAAQAGSTDAQFNLAVLYERGAGVGHSLTEAYKWYAIAAAQGDTEAKSRLSVLAGQMSPTEQKQAENAALSFKPSETASLIPATTPGLSTSPATEH